ncbi:hypothetical protein [Desulfobacula sp.]|uniref:hypothetical protein n=1 Tax=Desulfobacula sp. TaxID=2593537 RepID=UPI00261445EF|nr:hypothetical protein [Desulfobacula sp.]
MKGKTIIILILCPCLIVIGVCDIRAHQTKDYFPLQVGNTWSYTGNSLLSFAHNHAYQKPLFIIYMDKGIIHIKCQTFGIDQASLELTAHSDRYSAKKGGTV